MRRLVVLLVVVLAAVIQPVYADDLSNQEQDVKQQLANASAQITQLNLQMATLEQSLTNTQQRIDRERAQVRLLARALYAQPDSLFGMLFESASLTEAVTRISDLTSAGDRASATKRQLDKDLARMNEQKTQLQADRDRTTQLQKQLQAQFGKLVAQVVAARLQSPAPSQT